MPRNDMRRKSETRRMLIMMEVCDPYTTCAIKALATGSTGV